MDEKPRKNVEIALRWYCSTCGLVDVIWHSPRMTCDLKKEAILSEHKRQAPQCRKLDFRIQSDSETRPLEDENYAGGELLREGFKNVRVEGDKIIGEIPVNLDALLGGIMLQPHELPIVVDPSIPSDTIEFRSPSGRFLGAVTNIGRDDDDIPLP